MATKKDVKRVIKEIKSLCKADKYREAGEFMRANKHTFVSYIKCNGSNCFGYAYKFCDYFNMSSNDVYKLIY